MFTLLKFLGSSACSAETLSNQHYTLTRDPFRRLKQVGENRGAESAISRSDDRASRSPDRPSIDFGAQISLGDLLSLLGFNVSSRVPVNPRMTIYWAESWVLWLLALFSLCISFILFLPLLFFIEKEWGQREPSPLGRFDHSSIPLLSSFSFCVHHSLSPIFSFRA